MGGVTTTQEVGGPTLSARSQIRMVPSSLAEIKTSLEGCVASPQMPPWV